MKTMMLIITTALMMLFPFRHDDEPDYIFPSAFEKIQIVRAVPGEGSLLMGEVLPDINRLAQKIKKELNLPYHRSVIKLNQCSRNLVGNDQGPNILYLSENQGGFPRNGLILANGSDTVTYKDLHYVDLVIDEQGLAQGGLTIFSHELGHVMMNNIWPGYWNEQENRRSPKQHVSMGVTDYPTALYEGWGIHFERFVYEIDHYRNLSEQKYDYDRITGTLWHSRIDQSLRARATLTNDYIFRKFIPLKADLTRMSDEELILIDYTSPYFDRTRLKNAQEMLSCEGVLATLFYKMNANPKLQRNYGDRSFYNHFLITTLPEDVDPKTIFTPFENIYLKHFWIWNRLQKNGLNGDPPMIAYLREWIRSFPQDHNELVKLFISVTVGRTIGNEPGSVYEQMAMYGMLGDYGKFKEYSNYYFQLYKELLNRYYNGDIKIAQNVGPELWVSNPNVQIRTTLWSEQNKKALCINLNTAGPYDLAAYSNISVSQAQEIIAKRDSLGYFESKKQAEKFGIILN